MPARSGVLMSLGEPAQPDRSGPADHRRTGLIRAGIILGVCVAVLAVLAAGSALTLTTLVGGDTTVPLGTVVFKRADDLWLADLDAGTERLLVKAEFGDLVEVQRPEFAPPAIVDIDAGTISFIPEPFQDEDFPGYSYAPHIIAVESP